MFFEILLFAWILIKFDQNPVNYVKKIIHPAPVRDVQNCAWQFYKPPA
jgi:hypothetical protein